VRAATPVVVDNKPGASGNIGAALVAKAPPDGYTLMVTVNTFTITPALYSSLQYDPVKDFATIGARYRQSGAVSVSNNAALPAKRPRN
jgi:tripartite-type tricarboxylate transporter receptor subunit TctC